MEKSKKTCHTNLTFAEAMGEVVEVKQRKGKTITAGIDCLDTLKEDKKSWAQRGFQFSRSQRGPGEFHGTAWRGCPDITPPSAPSTGVGRPYTSLESPVKPYHRHKSRARRRDMFNNEEELSPRFVTTEALRVGDTRFPRATPQTTPKLGPGSYDTPLTVTGLDITTKKHTLNTMGRHHDGSQHNRLHREAKLRQEMGRQKNPSQLLDQYLNQNDRKSFEKTTSAKFLKKIQKDDNFHDYLKRKGYVDDQDYIDFRCRELLGRGCKEIHQDFRKNNASVSHNKLL
mmetsp:Transcript_6896/g.9250  ORF Transcript_6896/g.9250 Transcript_6896/m.9250 type:complete len:285 (+) Transcript_6896:196-1050(+)